MQTMITNCLAIPVEVDKSILIGSGLHFNSDFYKIIFGNVCNQKIKPMYFSLQSCFFFINFAGKVFLIH